MHASHRSNLLRKEPEHYTQFGWTEPPDLAYVWPVPMVKVEDEASTMVVPVKKTSRKKKAAAPVPPTAVKEPAMVVIADAETT